MTLYLARAVKLPSFELVHALIFASLIIVACIDASPQFWTIIIDTNIPLSIWFFFLEKTIIKAGKNLLKLPHTDRLDCRSLCIHQDSSAHMDMLK